MGALEFYAPKNKNTKMKGGVIMTPEFEKEYNAVKAEGEAIQSSINKFAVLGMVSGVAWSIAAVAVAAICVKKLLD